MQGSYNHPLFGTVVYEFEGTEENYDRGAEITIISGFDSRAIKKVLIPQLVGIKGSDGIKDGWFGLHERGHAQLEMVFSELERLDLMKHVDEAGGTINRRLRKPFNALGQKVKSTLPSNHAFGIAVDINPDAPNQGETTAPLAHVFLALGFNWGATFNDPMHFEVAKFIDDPQPPTLNELERCKQLASKQFQDFVDRRRGKRKSSSLSASVGIVAADSEFENEDQDLSLEDEHDHDAQP
ncbi:M15 family metallopeptidase [Variovorax sp. CCNWLW186]|uniref:M15 family metallopeptidase n=1 Tax=Variovorax sp. CCNWLW186 TaxID=3127473 RepID=UPI003078617D